MTTTDNAWRTCIQNTDGETTRLGLHTVHWKKDSSVLDAYATVAQNNSVATLFHTMRIDTTDLRVCCFGPGSVYSNLHTRNSVNIEAYFTKGKIACLRRKMAAKRAAVLAPNSKAEFEKTKRSLLSNLRGRFNSFKFNAKKSGLYDQIQSAETPQELALAMDALLKCIDAKAADINDGMKHKQLHGNLPKTFYGTEWNKVRNAWILQAYIHSIRANPTLLACVTNGPVVFLEVNTFDAPQRWSLAGDLADIKTQRAPIILDKIEQAVATTMHKVNSLRKFASSSEFKQTAFHDFFINTNKHLTAFLFLCACDMIRTPHSRFATALAEILRTNIH